MADRSCQRAISHWLKASGGRVPPDAAFDMLIKARKKQLQKADIIVGQAIEDRDKSGTTEIRLPYYTSQEDYDACHDDRYDWRMADVAMRIAAERLKGLGFDVEFAPVKRY